jgi:HTH-type transcriptional regulator / antitoxin HigA
MEEVKKFAEHIQPYWAVVEPVLTIQSAADYEEAIGRLNQLIDEVGTDEGHPLYGLLDTLGTIIRAYEEDHAGMPAVSGAEMLRFLMDEHGLTQSDLPNVGSQGVVSELLNGKRELNVRQIRALAQRFGVSPAVFV